MRHSSLPLREASLCPRLSHGKQRSSALPSRALQLSIHRQARTMAADSSSTPSTSTSTSATSTPEIIASLSELPPLPRYPAILLDQFGVLHDGQQPYAGSIEATRHLAEDQERKLLLLSNSSRWAIHALEKLDSMGFKREWFFGAVTSGEVAHRLLEARKRREGEAVVLDERGAPLDVALLGSKCFHVTWGARGAVSLDGLGLELVDDPSGADFILAHGTEAIGSSCGSSSPVELEALREILEQTAKEKRENGQAILLLCANPDLVTVNGSAGLVTMPGTLARWYGDAGGRVMLLGKPGPAIYSAAAALLPREREGAGGKLFPLLAIGDSLEHDIAGAAGAPCAEGVESLFIGGLIHAEELRVGKGGATTAAGDEPKKQQLDRGALERLKGNRPEKQRPTLAMLWYQV